MGINPINHKKINPIQEIQGIQNSQSIKSNKISGFSQGSDSNLIDRLNGLDNKLNQGGGVSLPSNVGQNKVHHKRHA